MMIRRRDLIKSIASCAALSALSDHPLAIWSPDPARPKSQYAENPPEHPKSTDDIYFSSSYVGIGKRFPLSMPDAYWLAFDHDYEDYEVYEGHGGGSDSLQVVSYKNGIYLYWAWNELLEIVVFKGWSGKVAETGINEISTSL